MRIHLKALGCRLNEAELDNWSRDFKTRGHRMTGDPADADLENRPLRVRCQAPSADGTALDAEPRP